MIKIAICDDDVRVCRILEGYVEQACRKMEVEADVSIYTGGRSLKEVLQEGEQFALIFLDIEIPYIDGIAIGDYVREVLQDNEIQIAYISGKESYAMRLFHSRPISFLIKPITLSQVEKVLHEAILIVSAMTKKFVYKKKKGVYFMEYSNIMYFKSSNRKIQMMLRNGREVEFYGKLETIYRQLSKREFLYIHKSFIVNAAFIKAFQYDSLVLLNGAVLPIAQSKRKKIRCDQLGFPIGGDR